MKYNKKGARLEYLKDQEEHPRTVYYVGYNVTPKQIKEVIKLYPSVKNAEISYKTGIEYKKLGYIIRMLQKNKMLSKRITFKKSVDDAINSIRKS